MGIVGIHRFFNTEYTEGAERKRRKGGGYTPTAV